MSDSLAVLAADMGGTRLRAGVILGDGSVAVRRERPTRFERGPRAVTDDLAHLLAEVASDASREGLRVAPGCAVAATGPVDASGSLVDPSNLGPAFHGFPLQAEIARRLDRDVRVGLDTHLALLGELEHGVLRGAREAVYVTISTGVGGALLAGGRLVLGADGLAGEVGHLPVMSRGPRCGCGARGHLEAVASGPAIAAAGEAAARNGRSPELARRVAAALDHHLTGRDVAQAAEAGDVAARAIMARSRAAVARAVVGLVDLLNPERVVLGGGVILADPAAWLAAVRRGLERTALVVHGTRVEVVLPGLGDDAGLVGCRPFLLGAGRPA